jgi:hypothetical protein
MKKLLTSILLSVVLVSGLFTTGCVTAPTVDKQKRIETEVQAITQVAMSVVLTENPKIRNGVIKAVDDLKVLENGTNNITINDVLLIVQRLDIKELKSSRGVLYISSGLLLLTSFNVPTALPLEQSNSIRGIAGALERGLTIALNSVPEAVKSQ